MEHLSRELTAITDLLRVNRCALNPHELFSADSPWQGSPLVGVEDLGTEEEEEDEEALVTGEEEEDEEDSVTGGVDEEDSVTGEEEVDSGPQMVEDSGAGVAAEVPPEEGVAAEEDSEQERRSRLSHTDMKVFICRGKEDALVTRNMVVGESVYGEKRMSVEEGETKIEYRAWNPFRSKLAAAILGGVDQIHIKPGSKVMYLGAASGTTVSHVSDIVGPEGLVYAVEFSHRSGRDLLNVAKKRTNIIPIIEDARHPHKYRMLANCIDSTAPPEAVFASEVKKMAGENMKPQEQLTLEPYERDHAVVVGIYRAPPKDKK
ncbi:hypothetical protein F7725_018929 [Dissostichus mawsoni]|uniref:rRNA 2'-O-methyltransferase fibrillarin n=1 Tax=Dissostichus mawsoni TaxID=36200 RepID=A0A7J5XT00_DISMA|nr:hypothetical protein F7725_018929 [Dissostichus mawsoni]